MSTPNAFGLAGVIGMPVVHSRSPTIHNFWLNACGIRGAYVPLAVSPERLKDALPGLVALGFRGSALTRVPAKVDFSVLRQGYRTIFANPNARVCYSAVFIEGCCVLGLFPYVASFLFEQGVTSLSIGGLVIAGFAFGGLFYTFSVSRFQPPRTSA